MELTQAVSSLYVLVTVLWWCHKAGRLSATAD